MKACYIVWRPSYIAVQSSRFCLPSFECLNKRHATPMKSIFIGTITFLVEDLEAAICEAEA
jgi:hypothetical protein